MLVTRFLGFGKPILDIPEANTLTKSHVLFIIIWLRSMTDVVRISLQLEKDYNLELSRSQLAEKDINKKRLQFKGTFDLMEILIFYTIIREST